MSDRVAFFYANGTDISPENMFGPIVGTLSAVITELRINVGDMKRPDFPVVAGLNGKTAPWPWGMVTNDPFVTLLDTNIFDAKKIQYPATAFPMDLSIGLCVSDTIKAINALPPGTPFGIGGYSQGAMVMSTVYNEIRTGSLTSRAPSFLGGVCFGNPRRQTNYRGEVGGTWSGSWGTPGSTTGGHGAAPTTGPMARLTGCDPTKWIEFLNFDDAFAAVGETPIEQDWTKLIDIASTIGTKVPHWTQWWDAVVNLESGLAQLPRVQEVVTTAMAAGPGLPFTDAAGVHFDSDINSHAAYMWRTPAGSTENLTSYQQAIKWLTEKASVYATAPIMLTANPTSSSTAGWVSNLIPPAA